MNASLLLTIATLALVVGPLLERVGRRLPVLAALIDGATVGGIVIGATVGLAALCAGPLTGASMNPARSLGPALVGGELSSLWLYCTAPFVGAIAALHGCRLLRGSKCCR